MKKIIVLLALALLMILSLAACGSDPAPGAEESPETGGSDGSQKGFTETVVVDSEECLIKITEMTLDEQEDVVLTVLCENRSEENRYRFSLADAAVNGVQCFPYFEMTLATGESKTQELRVSKKDDSFRGNDVGDITDLEMTFRVRPSNDWRAEDVALETVHVYPYGKDKAATFVRQAQPTDRIIIDNEFVTVTVIGYEYDAERGFTINVYLVNKGDQQMYVHPQYGMINDCAVGSPMSTPIALPGKLAFGPISWHPTSLAAHGITEVEELSFQLLVENIDVYPAVVFADEMITLHP